MTSEVPSWAASEGSDGLMSKSCRTGSWEMLMTGSCRSDSDMLDRLEIDNRFSFECADADLSRIELINRSVEMGEVVSGD